MKRKTIITEEWNILHTTRDNTPLYKENKTRKVGNRK